MTLAFIVAVMLAAGPVMAQQITSTPGSPDATMTIDGKQQNERTKQTETQ